MINGLYIHIPFCKNNCSCCDFFKIEKNKIKNWNLVINNFFIKLRNELKKYKKQLSNLKTIYIGGGIANILNNNNLKKLFKLLFSFLKKENIIEFTIEIDPLFLTKKQLEIFKIYGINRLSFSIKTFNNLLLKQINHKYSILKFIKLYNFAKELGFKNFNFDLFYNLKNQKIIHLKEDIEYIKKLKPTHISWYSIISDKDLNKNDKDQLAKTDYQFYNYINKELYKLDYKRYEISSYSLENKFKSIHNLCYWTNKTFLGLGPSASSFLKINNQKLIFINSLNIINWKETKIILTLKEYYFQILMMGLALVDGINLNIIDNNKAYLFFKIKIIKHINNKNLIIKNNNLLCTKKGYIILNEILIDLID